MMSMVTTMTEEIMVVTAGSPSEAPEYLGTNGLEWGRRQYVVASQIYLK